MRGCSASLFTLFEEGGDALSQQAWRVLVRLGFPEVQLELNELAAEGPTMLREWWVLDDVLRRSAAPPLPPLGAPPAPADPRPDALAVIPPPPPRTPRASQDLTFASRHFADFRLAAVLRRLVSDHPQLTTLKFEYCHFSESFCTQLPSVLAQFPNFSALSFKGAPSERRTESGGGRSGSFSGSFGGTPWSSPLGGSSSHNNSSAQDEPLAFLPIDLPPSVVELHLEAGAVSRNGVRVLGAALHSASALRVLSLANGGLRGSDLTPIFSLLKGGPGTPPCGLLQLSLGHNRLADAGTTQLVEALCAGGKTGACVIQTLDLSSNQLTVGSIDTLCRLLASLPSLEELDLRDNAFVVGQASATLVKGLQGAAVARLQGPGAAIEEIAKTGQALKGLLNIPAAMQGKGKAKDLLIAVLTNTSLCALHLDPGFFSQREAGQLAQKLAKNIEQRNAQREHKQLGADAPRMQMAPSPGGRLLTQRVLSWGRTQRSSTSSSEQPIVLGVLFSAPLVCTDPTGQGCPWTC